MGKTIKKLFQQHMNIIAYLFFGMCTTVINVIVYYICYNIIKFENASSTVIAWILSVLFAYITNKLFVFESKSFDGNVLKKEIIAFLGCRFFTGLIDVAIMYVAVDMLHRNSIIWKFASNILVIIINYIASKLIIFSLQIWTK